jgi:hypothetical protein
MVGTGFAVLHRVAMHDAIVRAPDERATGPVMKRA